MERTGIRSLVRAAGPDITPFLAGEIHRRAAALARAGRSVVPMHLGQPTRGPSEATIAAATRALTSGPNGYWESYELKERLARHYKERYDVEVAPERILLTNGASAALVAIFAALFASNERIALARPGYPAYRNTLVALGRTPVEVDCGDRSRHCMTAEALATLDPAPHGVVVASPSNPTGAMLDRAEFKALAHECRRREIVLISDEIYHGVTYSCRSVSALEIAPDAIVINSFSKFWRMPGWRLGWLVVPSPLIAKVATYVGNFFLTPSNVAQAAGVAALDDVNELRGAVIEYARNRKMLLRALPALGIQPIVEPEGAFYVYAHVGRYTRSSLEFCHRLLEETGVALAPGVDFDPTGGGEFVRFCFAVSTQEIALALERLAKWLRR
jgi:aspartate/methionine/tyrosine aminotransferase